MNVYKSPLMDNVQKLSRGLDVIDAIKLGGHRVFKLLGIVVWAIYDYPIYGFCSGLWTKGYKAYAPVWLLVEKSLNKNVYLRQQFLEEDRPLRNKAQ